VRGELIRAGGWGYLIGDEGSGYAIGAAALRAVMHAYDGRGPSTLLTELVLEHRGLSEPPELVRNIYGAESPRLDVASLAGLVEQAADQNDAVAIAILEESARQLSKSLSSVYPKLDSSAIPLILSGGVILHGEKLRQDLDRACKNMGLVFTDVHYVLEPAEGAVKLAREILSG
jgi:N-acetylglucosamine kinase-like BadF-type ATPase